MSDGSQYMKSQLLLFMANGHCTWQEIKEAVSLIEEEMRKPKKKVEKNGH